MTGVHSIGGVAGNSQRFSTASKGCECMISSRFLHIACPVSTTAETIKSRQVEHQNRKYSERTTSVNARVQWLYWVDIGRRRGLYDGKGQVSSGGQSREAQDSAGRSRQESGVKFE